LHFTQAGIGYAEVSVTLNMGRPYTSYTFERADPNADIAMFAGRPGVDEQVELGSVVGCTCQATYDCTQHGLLHRIGGFFGGDPFDVTVPFFWPLLPLAAYLQWKNAHLTDQNVAVLKALFVWK
jgi:hypothetical protein